MLQYDYHYRLQNLPIPNICIYQPIYRQRITIIISKTVKKCKQKVPETLMYIIDLEMDGITDAIELKQ